MLFSNPELPVSYYLLSLIFYFFVKSFISLLNACYTEKRIPGNMKPKPFFYLKILLLFRNMQVIYLYIQNFCLEFHGGSTAAKWNEEDVLCIGIWMLLFAEAMLALKRTLSTFSLVPAHPSYYKILTKSFRKSVQPDFSFLISFRD